MLLWICTQSCKSGAGIETILKRMLARASVAEGYNVLKRMLARASVAEGYNVHLSIRLLFVTQSRIKVDIVSQSVNPYQYFPTASPYGAHNRRMVGCLID
jgi:hypothetical protein